MDDIKLVPFVDSSDIYEQIHKWCSNKFVYEWFEQRILSYDEIVNKYKKKLNEGKQSLNIIMYNNIPIGLVQYYKYDDIIFDYLKEYNNIYEYDLFIGEEKYLSKGIGSKVILIIDKIIFNEHKADCIILRPFKRNTRAIKCYEKCGYQVINEYNGKDTIGNYEKCLVLIKKGE